MLLEKQDSRNRQLWGEATNDLESVMVLAGNCAVGEEVPRHQRRHKLNVVWRASTRSAFSVRSSVEADATVAALHAFIAGSKVYKKRLVAKLCRNQAALQNNGRAKHPQSQPSQIANRFEELASLWERETSMLSSPTRKASHPAYRAIVAMGP